MKILFINAYFYPEEIAFSHLERDIISALLGAGNEIEVICPIPTRGISKDKAKEYKNIRSETVFGVRSVRFWAPQEGKNPIIRALRYFWCNLREYQIAKKRCGVDAVFAVSTPPTQGLLAGKIAKKLGCKFVYSLQDIFPDSMVNAGMMKKDSILWRIGRKIEDFSYRSADRIIVISEDFRKNIMKKGVSEDKIAVVPNWADTEGIYNVSRKDNKIIKKYSLDTDKFYISYSGNIGHSQNMDMLLDVAKEISKTFDDIVFVIIGEGVAKAEVQNRIEAENIKNVILLPFQPYEDIAHVFSLGDLGLIISKQGIGSNSVPSKTWGYMAAERPILCSFDKGSELCKIIDNANCGFVAESSNKNELISQIKRAYSNIQELKNMGINGHNYLVKYNDKRTNLNKYVEVIRDVLPYKIEPSIK